MKYDPKNWTILILAAGKGTRLKSSIPKPLVKINDTSLIHVIAHKASNLVSRTIIAISEYTHDIQQEVADLPVECMMVTPNGTGGTVLQVVPAVTTPYLLITQADDSFFYKQSTLTALLSMQEATQAPFIIGVASMPADSPYDPVEHANGTYIAIRPRTDIFEGEYKSIVCGLYTSSPAWLEEHLPVVAPLSNGELPLPWVADEAPANSVPIFQVPLGEWHGINTPEELEAARKLADGLTIAEK